MHNDSVICRACGMSLDKANAGNAECPDTNSYEHDFPGYSLTFELVAVTEERPRE